MLLADFARTFICGRARPQPARRSEGGPKAKNFADGSAIRPYHLEMNRTVAIIGAGVSGLTCGVVFAERGYRTAIFAKEVGQQTTSGVAAAVWFPYDAEPPDKVIPWALRTFDLLVDLARVSESGVSMIELRQFSRTKEIQIPDWAIRLGAHPLSVMSSGVETSRGINSSAFKNG